MEDGLGASYKQNILSPKENVLILVLVEDGLGEIHHLQKITPQEHGLNPCFSGGWSRRLLPHYQRGPSNQVLILVLVEDGLGVRYIHRHPLEVIVLILVLVEDGLGV